jgi:HupE / UreJ protein
MQSKSIRFPALIPLILGAAVLAPFTGAHDIPSDVTIQAFLVPEGNRAHMLIRVPLVSMRDMNFPEQAGGYLDMERSAPLLADAAILWMANFIELYEGSTLLPKPTVVGSRISLPSDKSFQSYPEAMAHLRSPPLTNSTLMPWNQVSMDVLFDFPINSERSEFSIHPGLARLGLRVVTVLRFLPPNPAGGERVIRAFEYEGDPGLVRLDPRWYQAAGRFVGLGFRHILDGTDHLLFLFCLVIPFRKFRALIPIVTAFTIAHSITLIASAYNLGPDALWFPPMIEFGIALSIMYMALENIVGGSTVHKRWMIAFAFGLVHGFGFSFALRETLQFAGRHMLTSLLSFNVGVELGQLMVLLIMIPVLELLFRYVVAERMGTIILSALVAHTAWHWMSDRWAILSKFHIGMPEMTPSLLVTLLRWAMVVVAVAGVWWWIGVVRRGRAEKKAAKAGSPS